MAGINPNGTNKLGRHSLGTSFDCACGQTHSLPIRVCAIGADASQQLASYARQEMGSSCFVLSDENTRQAGGTDVLDALTTAGKIVREHVYPGDPFEATETLGDEVKGLAGDADFLVGVGSGTICDLVKYAGDKLGKPVLLYATAASMNGYTSAITAMKVRGLKRTLPCRPAEAVFGNPEHAATAPQRMTAAGVADFLSKCSSSADWRAAHLLHGAYYCRKPREFFEGSQERLLAAAPKIGEGDPEAVREILDALFLSGCSMVIAGSSAPASGGEHLISHYLDMKAALYDLPNDLHGTQVGVATVYCLGLWERILALNPADLDPEALAARQLDAGTIRQWIQDDWGDQVGAEVQAQWDEKVQSPDALAKSIHIFRDRFTELQRELPQDLLPASTVAEVIEAAGGPTQPKDLFAPLEEYRNAQQRARYIRNRFTVLDLADDLGLT
jgi:glycerol-1-phosphate dehydrogenase [NAD(P)+]